MLGRVLVVDDDAIAGGLSKELLIEGGFETDLLTDSLAALETLKKSRYDLVLLDILMPGIDGLTLCHKIKTDPALAALKVVMVSGKSFEADKERARQYGADLFIEKPYNVETFAQEVAEVLGRSQKAAPQPGGAPAAQILSAPQPVLEATVWGCRSHSAKKAASPSAYGWHTPCLSVETKNAFLIFDGGTGLKPLGEHLVKKGGPKELWMFLTHFHPGHAEGLGAFACAHSPNYKLHIGAARDPDKELADMVKESFELSLGDASLEAEIELYELREETYEILPGISISSFYANHPGTTMGYALELEGRKLVYCPDSEIYGEYATAMQDYDEKLSKICAGADLIIHNARYTPQDYRTLRNHGHSSFDSAVHFAGRNAIRRLILLHHDEQYKDADLDRIAADSQEIIAEKGYDLQCAMGREGLKVSI
ncbi:MAG: response regulator [Elusimicrobia bacterium]|nr:response regulator [Elusimicrobiota bacterium]